MNQVNQFECDEALLDRFLHNDLDTEQRNDLERHLDSCNTCARRLEDIAAGRWAWREVADCLPSDEFDSRSESDSLSILGIVTSNAGEADNQALLSREIAGWLDPTDDPDMLGRFAGYEIVGIIGHGGMGIVLKGFESSLNRYVAIKILAPRLATNGAARKRFAREAQAAAAVRHDNVIAVHRVDEWHGLPFLVMPYVAGISLQKRIDAEGPLGVEATLRIASQIASGLAAAHAQGLVHRDIKPANILLESGVERVTITDFGLARAIDDATITRTGIIAGTPQFMSPEQAQAKPLDHRSDLFSLGSLIYAMATGRAPFRSDNHTEILQRIANDPARPVREIEPSVPLWLSEIINWLQEKSPDDRSQSAGEVAELLSSWLSHLQQPEVVPEPKRRPQPASFLDSTPRPDRWRRRLVAVSAGLLGIMAGIILILETSKGTIRIESELDGVPIEVKRGDRVVESLTVSKSGASVRVAAGEYVVEIEGDIDGIMVRDGQVTMKRGDEHVVTIVQQASDAAAESTDGSPLGDERLADLRNEATSGVIPPSGRWEIRFSTPVVQTYARQLDFFGIELGAVGSGSQKIDYAYNLEEFKPARRSGKAADEKRLYMVSQPGGATAEFDRQLVARAGITTQRRLILQFYPKEIEDLLARLEMQANREAGHTDPREFLKTIFGVRLARGRCEFYVMDQHFRSAPMAAASTDIGELKTDVASPSLPAYPARPLDNALLRFVKTFTPKIRGESVACAAGGRLIAIANGSPRQIRQPDGTARVAYGWKPSVDILDAASGELVVSLNLTADADGNGVNPTASQFEVTAIAFSPMDSTLAVGTSIGQVALFNARSGAFWRSFNDEEGRHADKETPERGKTLRRAMGRINALAFSPDGELLATCGDSFADLSESRGGASRVGRRASGPGRLKVWDVESAKLKHDLAGYSHISAVAFSPDGRWLASAGSWHRKSYTGDGVILWDPHTGDPKRTFEINVIFNGSIHSIAFSPDCQWLAVGTQRYESDDSTSVFSSTGGVQLVQVSSGVVDWLQLVPTWANPVAFTPDGTNIVVLCGDQEMRFLDVETGNCNFATVSAYRWLRPWRDLAIDRSGNMVVGGVNENGGGRVNVYQLKGLSAGESGQSARLKATNPSHLEQGRDDDGPDTGMRPRAAPDTRPTYSNDQTQADLKRLQGGWELIAYEDADGRHPVTVNREQHELPYRILIEGTKLTGPYFPHLGPPRESELELDANKSPKQMHLTVDAGDGTLEISHMLYRFRGEHLEFSYADENARGLIPARFRKGKNSDNLITGVFKRVHDGEGESTPGMKKISVRDLKQLAQEMGPMNWPLQVHGDAGSYTAVLCGDQMVGGVRLRVVCTPETAQFTIQRAKEPDLEKASFGETEYETYGPFEGDPLTVLGIDSELVKRSRQPAFAELAHQTIQGMLEQKNDWLARLGVDLMKEILTNEELQRDFEWGNGVGLQAERNLDFVVRMLDEHRVRLLKGGIDLADVNRAVAYLEGKFAEHMPELPENHYATAEKLSYKSKEIMWGPENEGLRLGVMVETPVKLSTLHQIDAGAKLYVQNVSEHDVRFHLYKMGDQVRLNVVDQRGNEEVVERGDVIRRSSVAECPPVGWKLIPNAGTLVAVVPLTCVPGDGDIPETRFEHSFVTVRRLRADPGEYRATFLVPLNTVRNVRGKGEWYGELRSTVFTIEVVKENAGEDEQHVGKPKLDSAKY